MILNVLELLRFKDWLKNIILFFPLVFSNNILNHDKYEDLLISVVLFCLSASFIYIINDIKDVENDKLHIVKKETKPLASEKLSIFFAINLSLIILLVIIIILYFHQKIIIHIIFYIILNILYNFFLKKIAVIDLFILATGYVIRLVA